MHKLLIPEDDGHHVSNLGAILNGISVASSYSAGAHTHRQLMCTGKVVRSLLVRYMLRSRG
jgi:hypothetical protein